MVRTAKQWQGNGNRQGRWARMLSLITVIILSFGVSVYAAEQETVAAQEETDDYVLEDSVVTATKTGETRLQETPMAISAFSEEYLDNINVFSLQDLTQYVPNAQFEWFGPGVPYLYIRGVGSKMVSRGMEAAVGLYVDGVFIPRGMHTGNFYDLERVEVLRGPQGTMYGRGSAGGAINVISSRPTDELDLKVSAQIGNYNKTQVDGTISGPIVKDKLKARLTFSNSEHDGYIDNQAGPDIYDEDFYGLRGALEWTPTDKLDILFRGDYYDSSSRGQANKLLSDTGLSAGRALAAGIPRSTLYPDDFWTVSQAGSDPLLLKRFKGVSATAEYQLPYDMSLLSITSYRDSCYGWVQDVDGTPLSTFTARANQTDKTFTEELQLNGKSGRLTWLLGLYYLHGVEEVLTRNKFDFIIPGMVADILVEYETDAWAGFGTIKYAFTDKLSVEGGLRYSYEEGSVVRNTASTNIPFPPFNWEHPDDEEDWDAVTPKVGINYQLSDDALLYVIFSKGFKAGGYVDGNFPGDPWVDPEKLTAYEFGFKTDWFDRRLRANGAIFFYEYEDKQVRSLNPNTIVSQTLNAAEATIKGMELELTARPVKPLTLTASISYLDSEYDEFITELGGAAVDVSGNVLENAPEWKFSLGGQYVIRVSDYGFITLQGIVSWTDEQYFSQFESPVISEDDYTVIDGLVRFETIGGHWSVELWGKNLGEEEYLTSALDFSGDKIGFLGAPQTFGLQVTYKY